MVLHLYYYLKPNSISTNNSSSEFISHMTSESNILFIKFVFETISTYNHNHVLNP